MSVGALKFDPRVAVPLHPIFAGSYQPTACIIRQVILSGRNLKIRTLRFPLSKTNRVQGVGRTSESRRLRPHPKQE